MFNIIIDFSSHKDIDIVNNLALSSTKQEVAKWLQNLK